MPSERYRQIAADYVDSLEGSLPLAGVLVVAPTHAEANAITGEIRQQLRDAGKLGEEREFTRLVQVDTSEAERGQAYTYRPGDVLQFHQDAKGGFNKGDRLVVTDPAAVPLAEASKFSVYRTEKISPGRGRRDPLHGHGQDAAAATRSPQERRWPMPSPASPTPATSASITAMSSAKTPRISGMASWKRRSAARAAPSAACCWACRRRWAGRPICSSCMSVGDAGLGMGPRLCRRSGSVRKAAERDSRQMLALDLAAAVPALSEDEMRRRRDITRRQHQSVLDQIGAAWAKLWERQPEPPTPPLLPLPPGTHADRWQARQQERDYSHER